MNEQGQKRLRRVLKFLEDKKLLKPNIDVLDVGCGPGVYALSFAKQARTVCALDGAREMCDILEDKAKQEGLNNIKVLQRMWEDVDHPNISYINYEWIEDEPIDEAVVSLCNYFGRFTDITPKIKGIIIRYAQKHAHDGILHQVTRSRLGVMTWQVDR
jgi:predicted RNA methylase